MYLLHNTLPLKKPGATTDFVLIFDISAASLGKKFMCCDVSLLHLSKFTHTVIVGFINSHLEFHSVGIGLCLCVLTMISMCLKVLEESMVLDITGDIFLPMLALVFTITGRSLRGISAFDSIKSMWLGTSHHL